MTQKYEFRIYRRTQQVHIFEAQQGNMPNTSLCGEVKRESTLPGHSEPLDKAKKYAMEHSYTCTGCREILAKRD